MPFSDRMHLFTDLRLFNSRIEDRLGFEGTAKSGLKPLLRGCPVCVGPNRNYPVLRLGKYLISLHNDFSREGYVAVLEGHIHSGPILIPSFGFDSLFYLIKFTSRIGRTSGIAIVDTERGGRATGIDAELVLDRLRGSRSAELHTGDGSSPDHDLWYVLDKYILLIKRPEGDSFYQGWAEYAGQPGMPSGEYIERKRDIVRGIIGSRVRIIDTGLFKDLKFKNRTGRVVRTVPNTSVLLTPGSTLKTIIVEFGEDVGGHSMDGKFRRGSCLAVPLRKIEGMMGG